MDFFFHMIKSSNFRMAGFSLLNIDDEFPEAGLYLSRCY